MILEALVTTRDSQGCVNLAPMGPRVTHDFKRLTLRPYRTSTTYRNLKQNPCGVLHVTDDVLLFARGAIGRWDSLPAMQAIPGMQAERLCDCCRWYAFEVQELEDSQERTTIECRVTRSGGIREFFGLNRAMHAVIEAAILATRIGILRPGDILAPLPGLQSLVEKTGGPREHEAFTLLREYIAERLSGTGKT